MFFSFATYLYSLLLFGIADSILQRHKVPSCPASLIILWLTSIEHQLKISFLFCGSYQLTIENQSHDYTLSTQCFMLPNCLPCYCGPSIRLLPSKRYPRCPQFIIISLIPGTFPLHNKLFIIFHFNLYHLSREQSTTPQKM